MVVVVMHGDLIAVIMLKNKNNLLHQHGEAIIMIKNLKTQPIIVVGEPVEENLHGGNPNPQIRLKIIIIVPGVIQEQAQHGDKIQIITKLQIIIIPVEAGDKAITIIIILVPVVDGELLLHLLHRIIIKEKGDGVTVIEEVEDLVTETIIIITIGNFE